MSMRQGAESALASPWAKNAKNEFGSTHHWLRQKCITVLAARTPQSQKCVQPREDRADRPLRAAYHGHILELAEQLDAAEKHACATGDNGLVSAIQLVSGWEQYMAEVVQPRLANSRREAWQAPMPTNDGMLQEDFNTGVDIPETYPSVSDNYSSAYEMVCFAGFAFSRISPPRALLSDPTAVTAVTLWWCECGSVDFTSRKRSSCLSLTQISGFWAADRLLV
jgi:hypothetical protein